MSGTNHIRAIAGFYFLVGAIGILSAITLLIFGKSPNIGTTLSSVAYAIGAYYFSKGSNAAKIFLTVMSAFAFLLEGLIGVIAISDGRASGAVILLLASLSAYCLYALQFSASLKSEFAGRSAAYRLSKDKAAQSYYDELERSSSRE
ncbi:hypothetical protein LGH82_21125 [Mesorhizobium sp. PAMC28654]|uniref:hypothetical protein n=1 Tax=Mesorhizobium sp. PAMC28654 TaxID=2880934 RepID=UPI001D0B56E9|nr:hypothetical protein [Mesorhizobium sp. PAMC28654]UDL87667.1 hypothetical protein LGH82_21125 [Mesorhizobium sp. PAMC28654]